MREFILVCVILIDCKYLEVVCGTALTWTHMEAWPTHTDTHDCGALMSDAAWHLKLDEWLGFLQGLPSGFHRASILSTFRCVELSPMIDCAMTRKNCTALRVPLWHTAPEVFPQRASVSSMGVSVSQQWFPYMNMFGCFRGDLWYVHCIFRSAQCTLVNVITERKPEVHSRIENGSEVERRRSEDNDDAAELSQSAESRLHRSETTERYQTEVRYETVLRLENTISMPFLISSAPTHSHTDIQWCTVQGTRLKTDKSILLNSASRKAGDWPTVGSIVMYYVYNLNTCITCHLL